MAKDGTERPLGPSAESGATDAVTAAVAAAKARRLITLARVLNFHNEQYERFARQKSQVLFSCMPHHTCFAKSIRLESVFAGGAMEIAKRGKGRPKKEPDRITHEQFGRAARVLCAYHAKRRGGEKHSAAVTETAKQEALSTSEVKRILSNWQSQAASTVIRFEPKTLTEGDIERIRFIQAQLAALQGKKGLKPCEPKGTIYRIRFAERPDYPRHNRRDG